MVSSLIGTIDFMFGIICKGFRSTGWVSPCNCFAKGLTFLDLDRFVTVLCRAGRVSVQDSPQSYVSVRSKVYWLFVYSVSLDLVCVWWDEPRGSSLPS